LLHEKKLLNEALTAFEAFLKYVPQEDKQQIEDARAKIEEIKRNLK